MDIGGPGKFASSMCLGRCISFAKTLATRIQNGCDCITSTMPWAANVIWQAPSNFPASSMLISEAVFVTKTQWLLFGLSSVWCVIRIEYGLGSSSSNGLSGGAETGDFHVQKCLSGCVTERVAAGWKFRRKTFRSAEKILGIKWSIEELPSSISTARLWMMPNHTLTHRSPRRTKRSIFPSTRSGYRVSVRRWYIFPRLMQFVQWGEGSVVLTRLMPAPESRKHVAVRMHALLTP